MLSMLNLRRFILPVIALMLPVLAFAQSGKRVALVIGNAAYQYESTLKNPVNDAALIANTLRGGALGFTNVITLNNATRLDIRQKLEQFKLLAQGADVALIYYSGHGMINSKRQNHVLPVNMPSISANASLSVDVALQEFALAEDVLIDALEGATVQLLVLDACRDNVFAGVRSGSKGLVRRSDTARNRLIAYATDEGRVAQDGAGANSPYAQSLATHLTRTDLSIMQVFDEVQSDVEKIRAIFKAHSAAVI
jgi:uncharacterized protein